MNNVNISYYNYIENKNSKIRSTYIEILTGVIADSSKQILMFHAIVYNKIKTKENMLFFYYFITLNV